MTGHPLLQGEMAALRHCVFFCVGWQNALAAPIHHAAQQIGQAHVAQHFVRLPALLGNSVQVSQQVVYILL